MRVRTVARYCLGTIGRAREEDRENFFFLPRSPDRWSVLRESSNPAIGLTVGGMRGSGRIYEAIWDEVVAMRPVGTKGEIVAMKPIGMEEEVVAMKLVRTKGKR